MFEGLNRNQFTMELFENLTMIMYRINESRIRSLVLMNFDKVLHGFDGIPCIITHFDKILVDIGDIMIESITLTNVLVNL
jgi:hypothetical protein